MAGDITFDIGVEEEYFLIDPVTRALAPAIERVLPRAKAIAGDSVATEMHQVQIEIGTDGQWVWACPANRGFGGQEKPITTVTRARPWCCRFRALDGNPPSTASSD